MSQLLISLNGIDERVLKKNINGVLISETDKVKVVEKYTLLQANFNSIDDLIKAMQNDKKVMRGNLRFVLMEEIGKSFVNSSVDPHLVRDVLFSIGAS